MYRLKTAVLTTKHAKEQVIAPLFAEVLEMDVIVHAADTDMLGTFTGTIPRLGSMQETVIAKAKIGLEATGLPFGIASEGAFGPHPSNPFIAADTEMMVFIDTERDFTVIESLISTDTNYNPELKTDMRAHQNPQRMKVISQLCQKLVHRLTCLCPACGLPGFGFLEYKSGLPCESCGAPTDLIAKEIHGCVKCDYQKAILNEKYHETAPMQYCVYCNP